MLLDNSRALKRLNLDSTFDFPFVFSSLLTFFVYSYGELGSVIIHQTLYSMFPLSDFDPNLTVPLTPNEFVQRILVPEVATALIMQDMDLDKREAIRTLRDSAAYGVAMFPDTCGGASGSGGGAGAAAGDKIVKDRAKKRRKQLEAEETLGDAVYDEEQRKKAKGKGKGKERVGSVSMRGDTDISDARSPPPTISRSRKGKDKEVVVDDDDDRMIIDLDPTPPSKVRPRAKVKTKVKHVIEGEDSGVSDAGPSRPKPRPKPLGKKPSVTERPTHKRKSNDASDADRSPHLPKRSRYGDSSAGDDDSDGDEPLLPPPEVLERARSRASSMAHEDGGRVTFVPVISTDEEDEPALPSQPMKASSSFKARGRPQPTPFPMTGGASQQSVDSIEFVEPPGEPAVPSTRMTRSRSRSLARDSDDDDDVGDTTIRMDATPRPKKKEVKVKPVKVVKKKARSPSISIVEEPSSSSRKSVVFLIVDSTQLQC